jgi:hypothetical protein
VSDRPCRCLIAAGGARRGRSRRAGFAAVMAVLPALALWFLCGPVAGGYSCRHG